jgi:hypothetical protein
MVLSAAALAIFGLVGCASGTTGEPVSPTIKHGEKNPKLTVQAKEDAIGDHTLKVKGKPSKSKEATNDVKITVSKK